MNLNLISIIVSHQMKKGQLGLVTRMEGTIYIYSRFWLGNMNGGGGQVQTFLKWESDIKMHVTEGGCEVWTGLIGLGRGTSLGFL